MTIYQVKLKEKRDRENQLEFAEQTGIEKGIKKGIRKGIRKGILKGMEKGIEKGIEKGKNTMCNEIINRMKSKGYSYNEIAGITGLPLEHLQ